MRTDDEKFRQQDEAYAFPYHHIPHFDPRTGAGVSARSLGWGLEYLCYTQHILEMALGLAPASVLDAGCGDGRFLGLLGSAVARRVGVDPSERAIRFARAFHPEVEFHCGAMDRSLELGAPFDLAVAIEVLEHVPRGKTNSFLPALAEQVRSGGHVILSVPTKVARQLAKHHEHYDLAALMAEVEASGADLELIRVEYLCPQRPPALVRLALLLAQNRWWQLDLYALRPWIWRRVWECRRVDPEQGRHLAALFRRGVGPG